MKTELLKGKEILVEKGYTCILSNGKEMLFSNNRGVKPLLEFLESGKDFSGFFAVDKVVGKGAGMLYILLKVKAVYAITVSQPAYDILVKNGIEVFYDNKVKNIVNRLRDGLCPIEECVLNCDDPTLSLDLIKKKLKALSS